MCNSNWMSYSMSNWMTNSMDTSKDRSMSNNTSSTMKTVRRVSNSSYTCSKGFRLGGASMFSLERLGHRLVGNLTSWTGMNYSQKLGCG